MDKDKVTHIPEPPISKFIFGDTRFALVWLALRLYVGWIWIEAGWEKLISPAWIGSRAGDAVAGFSKAALLKTSGAHPDVSGWYAYWLQNVVIPNADIFAFVITFGELLVGIGLILGIFTGISSFFGAFMNMNYLFAGTVSINPIMFIIELFLILAWRTAGWIGADRYILPFLGVPWQPGYISKLFKKKT